MRDISVLRWIAIGFACLTLIVFGADIVNYLQTGQFGFKRVGEIWYALAPDSLNLFQVGVQRYLWPPLWDPGIVTILLSPAWAVPGALAVVFWLISLRGR